MKEMEPSHLEREYQLSGFMLLTYSATLEEVYYQIRLEKINKQTLKVPLKMMEDIIASGIFLSLQFPTSLLCYAAASSSCFSPWSKDGSNDGYRVIPPSTKKVLPVT